MASETPSFEYNFIRLDTKPSAQLSYFFLPATVHHEPQDRLVVFVNGLGRPQTSWASTIRKLHRLRPDGLPAMLTYDRFGQGQSLDRDPADEGAADPAHAHDCMSAVRDMRQLIQQVTGQFMGSGNLNEIRLVLIGNSIGCALVRLYAAEYPGTVAGVLFLDSTLTNSDFVSIIPDPDDRGKPVDTGITDDELRKARLVLRKVFHPDVGNKEGLSRKNLNQLLPHSHSPRLQGIGGRGPYLTVVGHDFDAFAKDSEEKLGISQLILQTYVNPFWHDYNKGLAKLTESERSQGPVQAPGASHFIQDDNPDFVAEKLLEIIDKSLA
ncbi:Alpha/beta hydrolase fold-1 [Thelonectria olida]|uniref:Alpha/beta hydrolase fold-1 n=1 Tax=Thelonectria olida TaxID=1576542 RepID=A0A9P8VUI7_9HYPO|nr:Alpha/beta hydrolase fold-1 [Thelonectria olida]